MKLNQFKLEKFWEKYEFNSPYLLCCSDIEPLKVSDVLNLATEEERNAFYNLSLGYTEVSGAPYLKKVIIKRLYYYFCWSPRGYFMGIISNY